MVAALISAVLFLLGLLGVAVVYYSLRQLALRRVGRERVFELAVGRGDTALEEEPNFLVQWLTLAGYRDRGAIWTFLGASALASAAGLVVTYGVHVAGLVSQAARSLERLPGTISDIFLPLIYLGPWLAGAMIASMPAVVVTRARRLRVSQIEQDLPIFLELFSTLSEAGLVFDAALDRILHSQPADRILAGEFRTFQAEVLAGRPRIQCLRRLSRRVDVTALTIFVSALVQAEQIGSGVAMVLRRQAEDLRDRRRERVLAQAQTLPVKLLFPLVICFLPGIFIITLGPIFYQFFQFSEGMMRGRGM